MKIKECMCENVIWLNPDTSVMDCVKTMKDNHIGSVPVCNDNKNIVGFVTDRDILLRAVACELDLNSTKLRDIMTSKVCCCNEDNDISTASKIMSENQIRRLPVVCDNQIVGIITLKDFVDNKNVDNNFVSKTYENICGCNVKNGE